MLLSFLVVLLSVLWEGVEGLEDRVEVARVADVVDAGKARAVQFSGVGFVLHQAAQGKVQINVEIDLLHSFLSLCLSPDIDSGYNQMLLQQFILDIVVAGIAVQRSLSLCSDGAELNDQRMPSLLEVTNSVSVSSCSVPVLPAAAGVAAGEAQP